MPRIHNPGVRRRSPTFETERMGPRHKAEDDEVVGESDDVGEERSATVRFRQPLHRCTVPLPTSGEETMPRASRVARDGAGG